VPGRNAHPAPHTRIRDRLRGKRKDSLKLIMARLAHGAATSISMSFLVMCAEKIMRLLGLFFVFILLVSAAFSGYMAHQISPRQVPNKDGTIG
ncbi:MAG: hypothetical protein QUV07_12530, partial [Cyanobium sp. CZS 25K]|nr:hypothetical protein [Cyanobium sp. CZS25K]